MITLKTLNDSIIDIIIECVNGSSSASDSRTKNCLRYIINQAIRQYSIPEKNWHLSKEADALWKKLTSQPIDGNYYKEIITCDALTEPIEVNIYKGASHQVQKRILKPGDKFIYNDIFHNEHVIPVSRIVDELFELWKNNNLTKDTVREKLDSMHIARITKDEDRRITSVSKRPGSFDDIIHNVYNKEANIFLIY